ncbi:hypothetical protein CsatA_009074 [Cannabis sativa]
MQAFENFITAAKSGGGEDLNGDMAELSLMQRTAENAFPLMLPNLSQQEPVQTRAALGFLLSDKGNFFWTRQLSFYPNNDKNYLSLYLTIIWCNDDDDESDDIAPSINWEVNVNFTLFVYNQTKDNYLAFQVVRRFHEMKKEWGFEQIISLETFKDVHNGYVVNDSCVFGAEVFTINQTAPISATLLVQRRFIDNPIFRWEIKEFFKITNKYEHNSQVFFSGAIEWHLSIGPNGQLSRDGKSLAMFLMMEHPKESTTYVEFCL